MSEHDEQVALFQWAELNLRKYPELVCMYAIPNAGKRSKLHGYKMKQEGLKPGVPDICLPVARGKYVGLYIELKVGKNKPTEKQLIWIDALRNEGHRVEVCYGWDSAKTVIEEYLSC